MADVERGPSPEGGREQRPEAWVAAAGVSQAGVTTLVAIRTSASTHTFGKQAPDQFMRL